MAAAARQHGQRSGQLSSLFRHTFVLYTLLAHICASVLVGALEASAVEDGTGMQMDSFQSGLHWTVMAWGESMCGYHVCCGEISSEWQCNARACDGVMCVGWFYGIVEWKDPFFNSSLTSLWPIFAERPEQRSHVRSLTHSLGVVWWCSADYAGGKRENLGPRYLQPLARWPLFLTPMSCMAGGHGVGCMRNRYWKYFLRRR